jgi:hypothetical protein
MNKTLALLGLALAALAPAHATDVGVSVQISQPGVYGRVDIGRFPQPTVVVQQPVVITRPVVVAPQPVYMWVPPGHRKNWRKHCGRYGACGTPVYFVRDQWYQQHVRPAPQRDDHGRRGRGRDDRHHHHGRGRDRDD